MRFSELDDLFFERSRAGLFVREHQLLRDGVVDSVGFDVKVVVITDNKCHFVKSTSNEPSYKIFSLNLTARRRSREPHFVVIVTERSDPNGRLDAMSLKGKAAAIRIGDVIPVVVIGDLTA